MEASRHKLLGAVVIGDSLGSLRDVVLEQLAGQEKPDSGLCLPVGDGVSLLVVDHLGGHNGDPQEQVVDKGVPDAPGLVNTFPKKKYLKNQHSTFFHV